MISPNPWVWIAALLTFCIFSFLYKDNPLFKLAEHLFVGSAVGYTIAITWHQAVIPKIITPMTKVWYVITTAPVGQLFTMSEFYYIIPIGLGLLMFSRFARQHAWLSRWPIAFVLGFGSGVSVPLSIQNYVFKQMEKTVAPQIPVANIPTILGVVVLVVGVFTTLFYFFFSISHKGKTRKVARIGIYFIMVAFGAGFGYTVMARVSLLIGRIQFLLHDWLGLIH